MIEIHSPSFHAGERADVIVLIECVKGAGATAGGWRQFAGAISSGDATAGDNDRIDADLAAEALNDHERQP